jgi:predicted ester cyclase
VNHVTGQTGIAAYGSVVEWARRLQGEEGVNVIDDLVAEDDRVVMFVTVNGRLSNEVQLFGMTFPANGSTFSNKHVHTFRVRDGKLTEHWATRDDLTMLLQIGGRVIGPASET